MERSFRVCFAASEVAPFAKTGGLADVAAALPPQLRRMGHDVRVFMPLYGSARLGTLVAAPVESIRDVPVQIGSTTYRFTARAVALPAGGHTVYLIDCPELYRREAIYTQHDDEAQRFLLFSRAVVECCQRLQWIPDVFHCNDWHTAMIPFLLRTIYEWDSPLQGSGTLLTIHNIGYQGAFSSAAVGVLGLDSWAHMFDQEELGHDRVNFLRTGLIYADAISTVSPTYAREIQTPEYGMGLEGVLRARRDTLVGILNGVDYELWNPERDPFIPHRFSRDDPQGKAANKRHLLATLKLEPAGTAPLVGIVSRLARQKGFDLCFDVLPDLLAREDLRLVVLGSGEAVYEEFFDRLQHSFPSRVCYHRGYHDELAHLIEAASDLFLMPSRYEPCGLNQMFGMKYGTLPIVRRTGGLADSVIPVTDNDGSGTGFVFEHYTPEGVRWALNRALELWRDRDAWRRLMLNAMAQNFSWDSQARPYAELYRKLVDRKVAGGG